MGKTGQGNNPTNGSLSLTLNSLRTFVELTESPKSEDSWFPLSEVALSEWEETNIPSSMQELKKIELSEKAQKRFLAHLNKMKMKWGVDVNFQVRSASNFASDCGLASSASSFAALTLAFKKFVEAKITNHSPNANLSLSDWAQISRQGSGSSCRSLGGPWVEWETSGNIKIHEFKMPPILHSVVLVEDAKKEVSSSEAHMRVLSSPEFLGRPERAQRRLDKLIQIWSQWGIRNSNKQDFMKRDWNSEGSLWAQSFEIIWDDFIDMHRLFETSQPPFKYMNEDSLRILKYLEQHWSLQGDGPWVTMDAGANIHLMFRQDQLQLRSQLERKWSEFKWFHSENV